MTDSANAWTDERLEQLRKLWDDGLSISQIGEALGVSRNAIAGKANRMGLPKRPSPISKTTTEVKKPAKAKPPAEPENLPLRLELRNLSWSRSKCCWPFGDPKRRASIFVAHVSCLASPIASNIARKPIRPRGTAADKNAAVMPV